MSEIKEEDAEAQKERIRKIINYQKSIYLSSSSSSSSVASCSSFSSSSKSSSLLDLMKGGSTSLRRLFNMEHTSLATHFSDYSGSPVTIPIPLWGSDTDTDDIIYEFTSWNAVERFRLGDERVSNELGKFTSEAKSLEGTFRSSKQRTRKINRRLARTRSFRRLPGFGIWRFKRFRLLRRLRIIICGKKF